MSYLKSLFYGDRCNQGFTLPELIVVVFGFSLIAVGVVSLVSNIFTEGNRQGTLLADTDQARKVSFKLMNELRNAVTSSTGAYPLASAGDQTITFYSNVDGGSDIERVRYYVQTGALYRAVIKPTGSPLAYTGSEVIQQVQRNVGNGASPLFYYYDGSFTGTSTPMSQPVNVTLVKLVKLDIKITNRAGVKNTSTYSVTSSGSIRNLKTNLGN